MNTPLIISKPDFENRIDISVNLNESKKLNQHIMHAQDFDLCELLTDTFYYFFMSFFNSDGTIKVTAPAEIADLYQGSDYVVSGITFANPGVKVVLVYFTGARLIRGLDAHITPNGFRDKVNEFSEQVTSGRKAFQANEYENQALAYWGKVLNYLKNNKDLYPLFFKDNCGYGVDAKRTRAKRVSVNGLKRY